MKLVSKVAAIAAVAVVAAGCSSGSSGTKKDAGNASTCTSTVAGYCALVDKARKEGSLVVLSGPEGVGDDGDFYKAFGKEFGIKVTVVGGSADEVNSKILAERKEGLYSADVSSQGDNGTQRLLKANAFQPLSPLIIDPTLTDRSSTTTWRLPYFPWEDPTTKNCTDIALEASTNFAPIYYNTDKVKGDDLAGLTSWASLLDPKWKGKIVMGDIASGDDNVDAAELWLGVGKDWFGGLIANQNPKVLPYGSARQEADALANGQYSIALFPAGEDSLQQVVDQHLPVKSLATTMSEGTSGKAIQRMCVMQHPKNPSAAQLFVNWSLSKEGQIAFNKTTKRTDRVAIRRDAPQGGIPNDVWTIASSIKQDSLIDVNGTAYRQAIDDEEAFSKQAFQAAGIKP